MCITILQLISILMLRVVTVISMCYHQSQECSIYIVRVLCCFCCVLRCFFVSLKIKDDLMPLSCKPRKSYPDESPETFMLPTKIWPLSNPLISFHWTNTIYWLGSNKHTLYKTNEQKPIFVIHVFAYKLLYLDL